jgi:succinate dehydrogenase/fumarate reductase cytochrome b subunit
MLIAAIIQMPFLIFMTLASIHSALGGAWALFYMPAILVLAMFGLPTPKTSPSSTITELALLQEAIVGGIILAFLALHRHFRSKRRNSA